MLRLGDGTDESHVRVQCALDELSPYVTELFDTDDLERGLAKTGLAVDASSLEKAWRADVNDVLARATLELRASPFAQRGGRSGRHTEHLGHMLTEMQILPRSYPGATW
jgi:ring-1,2-phenylacetyl-CoA epoxidase subunit PaaC